MKKRSGTCHLIRCRFLSFIVLVLQKMALCQFFTCKSKCAALIVNLGSFSRGRKQTAESAFSQHLEYDYSQPSKGSLVKSLAQRHLFRACEASEINQQELEFLHDRGWSVIRNRSGDIMIGSRTNFVGESMKRLAGSTLVGEAHNALPLTYMIVVIVYGKNSPNRPTGEQRGLSDGLVGYQSHEGRFRQDQSLYVPSKQCHRGRQGSTSPRSSGHNVLQTVFTTKWICSGAMQTWPCIGPQVGNKSQWTVAEECTNPFWIISLRRGPKPHKVHICAFPEYSTFPQTACAF